MSTKSNKMNNKAKSNAVQDLEIKDASLIFKTVWNELAADIGEDNLLFPKEIFWLNGAPGAGKGTNTQFILEHRDITAAPIVISEILSGKEAQKRMDAGLLVGDKEVFSLLLRQLLDPVYQNGVIVDGFPRTQVQVDCLKLFYEKIVSLRGTGNIKPRFHIVVLFIDEEESVKRQLHRGTVALAQNEKVNASGIGEASLVRKTDLDADAARRRYQTFKEVTYDSLQSLGRVFHYHLINANGSIQQVQDRILEELRYQSSLELSQETFARITRIPLASEIVKHARQQLVFRLDDYEAKHKDLFKKVVDLIELKFMPIVHRHAISGHATINTEDSVFDEPLALAMVIDIFSERGYHAIVDVQQVEVADSIDPKSNKILTRFKRVYHVQLNFKGCDIRRGH